MLQIEILHTHALDARVRQQLLGLCRDAFDEDLDGYFETIGAGMHLLGRVGRELVSHAMFVERWLQLPRGQLLRTAYVELVATHSGAQRRGHASALMRRVEEEIVSFDIGGLSPTDGTFYARLGWETWRGDLLVRTANGVAPAGDEGLMILRMPRTPASISLDEPISIEWRPGEIW